MSKVNLNKGKMCYYYEKTVNINNNTITVGGLSSKKLQDVDIDVFSNAGSFCDEIRYLSLNSKFSFS